MKKNISSEIEVNKYISLVEGLYLNENDAEKKEQNDSDNDNISYEDLNNNENIII